jgi:hypothetical protein
MLVYVLIVEVRTCAAELLSVSPFIKVFLLLLASELHNAVDVFFQTRFTRQGSG